jgi:hypothetical protein
VNSNREYEISVFCDTGTEFLNIVRMNFEF